MCLIVLAWNVHPEWRLVVGANRDEFYDRPSEPAGWWRHAPEVFGGRDLRAGGTWLGAGVQGRFAAVTNVRDPPAQRASARSRGELPATFLEGSMPAREFARHAQILRGAYNPFNLVVGDGEELWFVNSRAQAPLRLGAGIHGVSNAELDSAWPKVQRSKARFAEALGQLDPEPLVFELLADRCLVPDEELPDTGVGLEWERVLSAPFIATERYGTRSSTFVAQSDNRLRFVERSFEKGGAAGGERRVDR
jgi:uncharacterized protein with NRDE domain